MLTKETVLELSFISHNNNFFSALQNQESAKTVTLFQEELKQQHVLYVRVTKSNICPSAGAFNLIVTRTVLQL